MKKLSVGDSAPTFTVHDTYGKTVTFNHATHNATLIAFLRFSTCPFCNLAIHRLTVEYPILQSSGIDVVAFVQSSSNRIKEHIIEAHDEKPPFPIIPKQHPDVYKMYKVSPTLEQTPSVISSIPAWLHKIKHDGLGAVPIDGNLFLAPALFMVSSAGTVLLAKYASNLYDHELFTEIYDAGARAALL